MFSGFHQSEEEIFALILDVAAKDDRVRAVYMNGFRTNPNVPSDVQNRYGLGILTNFMVSVGKYLYM